MKDEQKDERTDHEEQVEIKQDKSLPVMHTNTFENQKRCEPCMHCGYHCKFLIDQKEE